MGFLKKLWLRLGEGRLLTNAEVDSNFSKLDAAVAGIVKGFYGSSDPAADPNFDYVIQPGFVWADSANGQLKRRNNGNTDWVVEKDLYQALIKVQTLYDTTAGRLPIVGWMGWGKSGSAVLNLTLPETVNAQFTSGLYGTIGSAIGLTGNTVGGLLVLSGENTVTQIAWAGSSGLRARVNLASPPDSSSWGPWGSVGAAPATQAEVDAGTDNSKFVTPATLRAYFWSNAFTFKKLDGDSVVFKKVGKGDVYIKAGTVIGTVGKYIKFDTDTLVADSSTLNVGTDFSLWIGPTDSKFVQADKFWDKAESPQPGAVKIGGFHTGITSSTAVPGVANNGFQSKEAGDSLPTPGPNGYGGPMNWYQADIDKIVCANQFTFWDLCWHAASEQRGMAQDPRTKAWVAIYFMSDNPDFYGPSASSTTIASGTVLPLIPTIWGGNGTTRYQYFNIFDATELVTAYGGRLILAHEFPAFAFGVREQISAGGATSTYPVTERLVGVTSQIGVEQATGVAYTYGGTFSGYVPSGTSAQWASVGRGSTVWTAGRIMLGGARSNGTNSGSRCLYLIDNVVFSANMWNYSVRMASDHVNSGTIA